MKARKETGLPIVTEIMNISTLDLFADVDIIQVGARNMQNFDLLKELGKTNKPILLKRGLANTLQELLMSAEYIMSEGNENVILCERGIRTFETATRNTLDLSAVTVLHNLTHLTDENFIAIKSYEIERPTSDVHDFYRNYVRAVDGIEPQLIKNEEVRRVLLVMEACFKCAETGEVVRKTI